MRIIAGKFRSRRLVAPPGLGTRPTTDRVREAWFSMLGPIDGRVLDIYGGTGALGFEALSRGASFVVFVESARAAQRCILENARALEVEDRIELVKTPVEASFAAIRRFGPFDLVLTDPPWTDLERAGGVLARLLTRELFTTGGRLVLGHPRDRALRPADGAGLRELKSRAWGDSAATFFECNPGEAETDS